MSFAFAPAARLVREPCKQPAGPQIRRRGRGRPLVAAAESGRGWESAQAAWRSQSATLKAKLEEWARQQRLNERINSGLDTASRVAQQAAKQAQSTATAIDEEYDVSGRAAEAARSVNGAAEELNSRFQIRRRLRNLLTDAKRKLPVIWRRLQDFSNTPMGAITFFFAFLVSVFTGAFWVILRLLFSLFWIGILMSPIIINYLNARMMAEQQRRYREYAEEQKRRQANPFHGTIFEDLFVWGQRRDGSKKVVLDSQDVIDVSYEHIYESE